MTPERWRQIEDVFQTAVERAPGERTAWLETACAGDAGLRREVESLLAHDQTSGFLEPLIEDAVHGAGWDEAGRAEPAIGRRIGPYRVTGSLGQGGMGAVFLAVRDDGQYRKQVAIKLIQPGLIDTAMLARFRHERQILATLEHPHIARLLDGGETEEGLPYFVMEHVEGQPITDYCRAHELPTAARLELFGRVCSAVGYAHQNLVIHRDLKPGNILVGRDGVPKLVDFGIAKLLQTELEQGAQTQPASLMRMLTPQYASPEQLRGEPLTTATDVYSLGAVLYELMDGHRPHRVGNLDNKDLDAIVARAMHDEPSGRYAAVEQLADDLRCHLEGRPVAARGDSLAYRTATLVRRYKLAGAGAALGLLCVAAAVATVYYRSHRDDRVLRAELAQAHQALCRAQPAEPLGPPGHSERERGCARLAEALARLGAPVAPPSPGP